MSDTVTTGAISSAVTLLVAWGGWCYSRRDKKEAGDATVQVARIEAENATEARLMTRISELEHAERESAELLAQCNKDLAKSEARVEVLTSKIEDKQTHIEGLAEQIGIAAAANNEAKLEIEKLKSERDRLKQMIGE